MMSEESVEDRVWKIIKRLEKSFQRDVYGAGSINQQVQIEIKKIGEPALPVLIQASENQDETVRRIAIRLRSLFDGQALEAFSQALCDPEVKVRRMAAKELMYMAEDNGDVVLELLGRAQEDPDMEVRQNAFYGLYKIGKPALPLLARALEDPDSTNVDIVIRRYRLHDIDAGDIAEALLNELVIRASGQPSERFNYDVVAIGLRNLIDRNPQLRGRIISKLCDLAYEYDNEVRQRAISIARELDLDEFALLVKAKGEESPDKAAEIMRLLGGSEALSYFSSELQSRVRQEYEPLQDLEETARVRWEELTKQGRISFWLNLAFSIGLFLLGATIIIVGLCMLVYSDYWVQQLVGSLGALGSLITTVAGKFWAEPAERVHKFSAQQARLQVAFIGYMNRTAQIRLIFEQNYTMADSRIGLPELEEFQRMLSEAAEQATEQLGDN